MYCRLCKQEYFVFTVENYRELFVLQYKPTLSPPQHAKAVVERQLEVIYYIKIDNYFILISLSFECDFFKSRVLLKGLCLDSLYAC